MSKLFVSLMSAPALELDQVISTLEPYCDGWHVDIMDMHFVPNLALSPEFVNELAQKTKKELFVHVMTESPEKIISLLKLPAKTIIAVHRPSTAHLRDLITQITRHGWGASVALAPYEPIDHALGVIDLLAQVLVMSVEPGFSGQEFQPAALTKVRELCKYRDSHKKNFRIGIDGGINQSNIVEVVRAGVDDIVVGSGIFAHKNPVQELKNLRKLSFDYLNARTIYE